MSCDPLLSPQDPLEMCRYVASLLRKDPPEDAAAHSKWCAEHVLPGGSHYSHIKKAIVHGIEHAAL